MFILVQGVWRQVVLGMACLCLTSISACAHTPSQQQAAQNQRLQNVCAHNILFKKYDCSASEIQAAALQGDADAQYTLAYMYYYGLGTVADQATALTWMHKAAAQGQGLAIAALKLVDQVAPSTTPAVVSQSTSAAAVSTQQATSVAKSASVLQATAQPKLKTNSSAPVCLATYGQSLNTVQMKAALPHAAYTLQLASGHALPGVLSLARRSSLPGVQVYQITAAQLPARYIAVYGDYPSASAALHAITCLQKTPGVGRQYVGVWRRPLADLAKYRRVFPG